MNISPDLSAASKSCTRPASAYLLPSLSQVLFLCIFLSLSLRGGALLRDGDTGWHIRTGEYIIRTHSVPRADIYSFITPSPSWIAHEWFSDLIMAAVHRFSGLNGIVILFSLVFASVYYFLFQWMREGKANILLTVLIVLLVTRASFVHCLARPHLFSLAFTLSFYYILNAFHYKSVNRLYLLPPLMLLWANMHGGFMLGLVLIGIYFVSNTIRLYSSETIERSPQVRKLKSLALTGALCLAATLANPYGYHILIYPFTVISTTIFQNNIQEFLSPDFHLSTITPYKLLLYITVAVFAASRRKPDIVELLLTLVFIHMSFTSVRYIPLFAIVIAPILSSHIASLMEAGNGAFLGFLKKRSDAIAARDTARRGYLLVLVTIAAVAALMASGRIKSAFGTETKPVAAVEFMKREHVKGNMFTEMQFGDYVIYAAPEYKVFADGRMDMYGPDHFKDYLTVMGLGPGWEDILRRHHIDWVFFNSDSALSTLLAEKKEWHLIYSDKVASIFLRDTDANRELIRKYSGVKRIIAANDPRTPSRDVPRVN